MEVKRKKGVCGLSTFGMGEGRRVTSFGEKSLLGNGKTEDKNFQTYNVSINYAISKSTKLITMTFQGPLFRAQLEAYLDEHPEFLESYLKRKVDKSRLVQWMTVNEESTNYVY